MTIIDSCSFQEAGPVLFTIRFGRFPVTLSYWYHRLPGRRDDCRLYYITYLHVFVIFCIQFLFSIHLRNFNYSLYKLVNHLNI